MDKSVDKQDAGEIQVIMAADMVTMSYTLATACRSWGRYAEMMLLYLVKLAQADILNMDFKNGIDINEHLPSFNSFKFEDYGVSIAVSIPISSLKGNDKDYTNYQFILDQLKMVKHQDVEWEDCVTDRKGNFVYDSKGNRKTKTVSSSLIYRVEIDHEKAGYVKVWADKETWRIMENCTRGFRTFDINVARRLKNKYAIRFYEILSRQTEPITFSLDKLKKIFGVADKYNRPNDFIRKVIDPAMKELNEKSPYTFTYLVNRNKTATTKGIPPITSITLFPKRQLHLLTPKTTDGIDQVGVFLSQEVRNQLKAMGFSYLEIKNNLELFAKAEKEFGKGEHLDDLDLLGFLYKLENKHSDIIDNFKAYVVGSVKKHLFEEYHIDFKTSRQLAKEQKAQAAMAKLAAQKSKNTATANKGPGNAGEMINDLLNSMKKRD